MKALHFIRHFRTKENEQELILGRLDPVSVVRDAIKGIDTLMQTKDKIVIFSSPARRCVETATDLVESLELKPMSVIYTDLLLERDMGAWQGLEKKYVREMFQDFFVNGLMDPFATPPGGESFRAFFCRVSAALDLVNIESKGSVSAIVVSHNQTLKLMAHLYDRDFFLTKWFSMNFGHAELVKHAAADRYY